MTILEKIVEQKKREVRQLPQRTVTPADIREMLAERPVRRDFAAALRHPANAKVALIAEVKKASPSAGVIRPDFDPVATARTYEAAGANCLSVLTDERFFQGSLRYLRQIREAVQLPLLRKDFIIDQRQILEAAEHGADAVLLIVSILDDDNLKRFHALAIEGGLSALVEVHDERELERAVAVGAGLIGINNRNLATFDVDLGTTERVAARLREMAPAVYREPLLVAESGIRTSEDVMRLARCGARAMLVGESLMRDPGLVGKLLGAVV